MDKIAKDYKFFRDHFYPETESESTSVKPFLFVEAESTESLIKIKFVSFAVNMKVKSNASFIEITSCNSY